MKGRKLLLFLMLLGILKISAQNTALTGSVVDALSNDPIAGARLKLEGTAYIKTSGQDGSFAFADSSLESGSYILEVSKAGYILLRISVNLVGGTAKSLELIPLQPDFMKEQVQLATISLSESELNEDQGETDNITGLLYATRDVFLNAAAFDFSQTFFKPRGLGSEYGTVSINGVEMNKFFDGRPQWSNWGGLNDLQRNQVFANALVPGETTFGNLAGNTNIIMRASQYAKNGKLSYASANRSYSGRLMATYSSGEKPGGWWYALGLARRFAKEAYVEGTLYDANSFFISAEKKLNNAHSINFTGFYTPNIRGKSSANTQEVYDLKGRKYNSFWGIQNGEIRNSRIKEVKEPILMLNHFWKLSEKLKINNNVAYQFGSIGNTRLDFGGTRLVTQTDGQQSFVGGGSNPDPSYYQKLPSYFLRFFDNQNFEAAYRAQKDFQQNGQIDWRELYKANSSSLNNGGNSIYVSAEDKVEDKLLNVNSILTANINSSLMLTAKLKFSNLNSENYAEVNDLLGGTGYLDVDFFSEGDKAQSDLLNPNRIAKLGERFKYNFKWKAASAEAFINALIRTEKWDSYAAFSLSQTNYQREGLYKNGNFPESSFGKSKALDFTDYGAKAGTVWKITGKHLLEFNAGYFTKAPALKNSFSNSRQNNNVVEGINSERIYSGDASYIFRSSFLKARLTGYFTQINNATEISFYYADGLSGLGRNSTTAFVQEILTGIDKQHLGLEMGAEAQVTSTLKLKTAVAMGQFTYNNNPNLKLTSDDFIEAQDYGESNLKNYRIAGGPQRAAQIGFEYRDPDFWWFGTTLNYFSHAFADVSPLARTSNFATDSDGLPLLNYDENMARDLLKQEQFDDYFLLNTVGGKSWRIKNYYIGFFVSINNILDELYKTGGFEQSRNANFRTLKADRDREQPVFGSKYWYGTGASYYGNVYIRF
ncbi:carboxypeptidase regulatory-like domain-containing protein [Gillisia sp. Hel_I_86]|uniref:carboxypeptidase regulatory-like domain-containing protein n=1 Tax=Gillisia sp. Hel_I_86 TaxID=1249981 RepID=UPI0011A44F37|nr:carboxypeptidase regulatory-like domain-containing protein [Gillisia sp. Hel_I_86]